MILPRGRIAQPPDGGIRFLFPVPDERQVWIDRGSANLA
jgi:hypothetical protein